MWPACSTWAGIGASSLLAPGAGVFGIFQNMVPAGNDGHPWPSLGALCPGSSAPKRDRAGRGRQALFYLYLDKFIRGLMPPLQLPAPPASPSLTGLMSACLCDNGSQPTLALASYLSVYRHPQGRR